MDFDFAFILVVALLVAGLIWAYDALMLAPKRKRAAQAETDQEKAGRLAQEPVLVEYARSFFPVILVVLLLRSFLVEPFRIPSASMVPTLLIGDFILVNKYTYGIRLPVLNKKVIEINEPKRGDVVVFRYPKDPSTDYIKRVIGLPGDKVTYNYYTKTLYINGNPMSQKEIGSYTGVEVGMVMPTMSRRLEQLEGVEHDILVYPASMFDAAQWGEWEVPAGHYFVMGDNRDNSHDSRAWGFVPEENLVGKAFMIWMNFNWNSANGMIAWSRIGTMIH